MQASLSVAASASSSQPTSPRAVEEHHSSAAARLLQPHRLEVLAARLLRVDLVLLGDVLDGGHRVDRDLVEAQVEAGQRRVGGRRRKVKRRLLRLCLVRVLWIGLQ